MKDKMEKPDAFVVAGQFLTDRYVAGKDSQGEKVKTLRWLEDDFYAWNDGCYHRVKDNVIKAEVAEYLHNQGLPVTTHSIASIVLCLISITNVGLDITLNSWLDGVKGARVFPLKNGNVSFTDIDIETNRPRLLPHTPWYFTLSKADYDYDPKAECPFFEAFLHDMSCNMKYVSLLQQWAGYLFTPDLRQQKFLLCCGEGANGKSVFFDVIKSLVGEHNISELSLCSFSPKVSQFALHSTLGKMVNMSTESTHFIEEEGENVLKSYVAGDTMHFNRKFREPISAKPTAKIMIATNQLPRFNDRTQAIWRRILLVPFPKVIEDEQQIKDLADQLKRELPGIFNWALDGLDKLNKAGRFIEPQENKELLEEYRRDSDPARAFLLENYIFSPNGQGQPCIKLYEEYVQYCNMNNCLPMRNTQFGQHVKRIFPQTERVRWGSDNNRIYTYRGLVSQASSVALTSYAS
jgi:P4 family phage/plasmid primase-like protien